MPAEERMKLVYLLSTLFFLCNFNVNANHAKTLTIYTYDSFVSEWGPGPIIKKKFEEKFNSHLEFISVDSAATLLTKIILEGPVSEINLTENTQPAIFLVSYSIFSVMEKEFNINLNKAN